MFVPRRRADQVAGLHAGHRRGVATGEALPDRHPQRARLRVSPVSGHGSALPARAGGADRVRHGGVPGGVFRGERGGWVAEQRRGVCPEGARRNGGPHRVGAQVPAHQGAGTLRVLSISGTGAGGRRGAARGARARNGARAASDAGPRRRVDGGGLGRGGDDAGAGARGR